MRVITNKFAKKCKSCDVMVQVGQGFAYNDGRWNTVCNSSACHRKLGVEPSKASAPQEKKITEDGKVFFPYDRDTVSLVKSLPGARWNPDDKHWTISMKPEDAPRILEVAKQVGFEIPAVLQKQGREGTPESRAAKKRAAKTYGDKKLRPFQKEGVEFLALHKRAILADDMGLGKSLSNGTPVLTPDGWIPIEELSVGDEVIGKNGKPTKVTGVYPQGVLPIFNVTFSDGRNVQCSEDHLWGVQTPNDRVRNPDKFRTHTLKEIVDVGLEDHNGNRKWFIPVTEPVEHFEKEFPVHPYVLGALLANGTLSRAVFHHGLPEQREKLAEFGVELEHQEYDKEYTFLVKNGEELKAGIKKLNLQYKTSYNKNIPEIYFFGSVEQRLLLLQGLVDNDGTVSKDGMIVEYNTVSSQLAEDVIRLVRSLGGVVKFSTRKPKYTYKGEIKIGSTDHRIRIKLPSDMCPVTIPFKKERFVANSKYPPALSIADVIEAGETECTCISVDAEDNLFITKDYIITHNTVQALIALPAGARVILACPAAVKYNWQDEIDMWRPEFKVHICNGRDSFVFPKKGEIVIINYDILPAWLKPTEEIGKTKKGKPILTAKLTKKQEAELAKCHIISDECHLTKNYKAARSQKFKEMTQRCAVTWGLTGTPLMNRATDLYGVLEAGSMGHIFGSWYKFVDLFNGSRNPFGGYEFGMPKPEVPERLKRVMLRRLKKDVLPELPGKTYQTVKVDVGKELAEEMQEMYEGIIDGLTADGRAPSEQEIEDAFASLPSFYEFSSIRAKLAEGRIAPMMEIVESYEESEEPLLVFSAHRAPIDTLGQRDGWAAITGDTSAEKRQAIKHRFQNGELKGVALTIQAGGVGLTLTHASHALFIDLDWTPAMNIQAEDRIVRIGQLAKGIIIKRMVSDHPLDKHMHKLIEYKIELAQRALDESLKVKPMKPTKSKAVNVVEETDEELEARIRAATEEAERAEALGRINGVLGRESAKVSDTPEPKLTSERKVLLRNALSYMLGRCDGAETKDGMGFSKPDVGMSRWIENTGLLDDDEKPFRLLERMLVRYRRQLSEEFGEIWE